MWGFGEAESKIKETKKGKTNKTILINSQRKWVACK